MERVDLIDGMEFADADEAPRTFMFAAAASKAAMLPAPEEVADPEAGWARRNPARAMAFLYVSPRDCGAVDELLAF